MISLENRIKQFIGSVVGKVIEKTPGITKIALDQVLEDNLELYGDITKPVYDGQTELIAKKYFETELLPKRLSEAEQEGIPITYALIDLDDLKLINKEGHGAGDFAIYRLSQLIRSSFRTRERRKKGFSLRAILGNKRKFDRRENLHYNDSVCKGYAGSSTQNPEVSSARVGYGDEFGVLLYNCTQEQAVEVMNRFLKNLGANSFRYWDKDIPVTASIGIAQYEPGLRPKDLIERSDKALYRAKELGRNRIESHVMNNK